MKGPGKYDDICTKVREDAQATGVVVIILGGKEGNGFSVQGPFEVIATLPDTLEYIAKQIRRDVARSSH